MRENSLLHKMGLLNGDIVHRVNGQALTTVEAALAAYEEHKMSSTFLLEITRDGTPRTLTVHVQ